MVNASYNILSIKNIAITSTMTMSQDLPATRPGSNNGVGYQT